MTLPLTPEMVEAAYEYLRSTPPFNKWKLPEADDVIFHVLKLSADCAQYRWNGKQHEISISASNVGYTITLMHYMAHEMIHLYLEETGQETRVGGQDSHNAAFKKYAATVCKIHGFDPKLFY